MAGMLPLHKPSTDSPSSEILHQAELQGFFFLQTTFTLQRRLWSAENFIAHMPICYIFSTALRKDLLFWLLALSLCSGRTKPTEHLYLRTNSSFKYNFHSNRNTHLSYDCSEAQGFSLP